MQHLMNLETTSIMKLDYTSLMLGRLQTTLTILKIILSIITISMFLEINIKFFVMLHQLHTNH